MDLNIDDRLRTKMNELVGYFQTATPQAQQ